MSMNASMTTGDDHDDVASGAHSQATPSEWPFSD